MTKYEMEQLQPTDKNYQAKYDEFKSLEKRVIDCTKMIEADNTYLLDMLLLDLDDLDYMLTKRDSEVMTNDDAKKNAFLNQLLSFTDGVQKNKTKFIITTNQHFEDVDTALLRKGRLFDILEFRKLKNDEALTIWLSEDLKEEEFRKIFSDDVSQADLGSEIAKRKNKRIKNTISSYLKEKDISKIQRKSKRMKL